MRRLSSYFALNLFINYAMNFKKREIEKAKSEKMRKKWKLIKTANEKLSRRIYYILYAFIIIYIHIYLTS